MPRRGKEPGDEGAGALFTERLNSLFATRVNPATGQPYSLREVSEATGGLVSRAYLSTLRRGLVTMPGVPIVEALARFFGVPTGYFLGHDTGDVPPHDDGATDENDEEAALRLALSDPLVRETALRVKDFGPEEWKLMIGMVESQMALRRLAEERARAGAAGVTPSPDSLPPPSSPRPRDISTGRRRTTRRSDAADTGAGGDTSE